ncbi:2-hydroxyacid dehydrogenase [Clostridium sp. M62/1]|uniref:2-hydroxyacid dehydrogenase n=1 Tax=Clostridium sp. M62/1 TaxID=411486 RepID=UPI0001973D95|nr:2-hydroxyacid dehydrogenase [Clostridium sp. M62/1]EFE12761.1 4-phosphoerythronate dehydrogenase [Clostridium sp. M62/1]UEB79306.1 2-hydroxyacid dehydrogenase [Clostridium sp. M62/1]
MTKVVLAGNYPAHTYERLKTMLENLDCTLTKVETEEEYQKMTDAEIMVLRIFKARQDVIERNKGLKMIIRWGAGFDSVDIEAAGKNGVVVANTPGANAPAVSELAVMLMLAVGRHLIDHMDSLRKGVWSKNTYINQSYTLNRKLVGIIGAGNIGRQTAKKAQAFGAEIQYYDPFRLSPEREQELGLRYVPLETLLKTSDVISLHVPLTDSNRHMIGAEEISQMKDGAILVNTARGGLVDDQALAEAVRSGKLAGAGLDVVENEPLKEDDSLLTTPGIVVTPHVGGGTADIGDEILPMLAKEIERVINGQMPEHAVNLEYLKK